MSSLLSHYNGRESFGMEDSSTYEIRRWNYCFTASNLIWQPGACQQISSWEHCTYVWFDIHFFSLRLYFRSRSRLPFLIIPSAHVVESWGACKVRQGPHQNPRNAFQRLHLYTSCSHLGRCIKKMRRGFLFFLQRNFRTLILQSQSQPSSGKSSHWHDIPLLNCLVQSKYGVISDRINVSKCKICFYFHRTLWQGHGSKSIQDMM